jgi:hypothetical protein
MTPRRLRAIRQPSNTRTQRYPRRETKVSHIPSQKSKRAQDLAGHFISKAYPDHRPSRSRIRPFTITRRESTTSITIGKRTSCHLSNRVVIIEGHGTKRTYPSCAVKDHIERWKKLIFPDPEKPNSGVEACFNLICLSANAHIRPNFDQESFPNTPVTGVQGSLSHGFLLLFICGFSVSVCTQTIIDHICFRSRRCLRLVTRLLH